MCWGKYPKMGHETFARSVTTATLTSVFVAFPCLLILRFGLRLTWSELAGPLILFAAVQAAFFTGIVLIRKYKSVRAAALIFGAYAIALFFLVAHYALRMGLHKGFENRDLWRFSAFILALALGVVLMPRQWRQSFFSEGVKCVRCQHYHEGHDCSCGCRADQFKWPSIGSGFP